MKIRSKLGRIKQYSFGDICRQLPRRILWAWDRFSPWFLRGRFYSNSIKLSLTKNSGDGKRILGVWDYKALPWSVGDPLVFVEILSILKLKMNADAVDICVVYDRDNPSGNRGYYFKSNITDENAVDYINDYLPLFRTCPYLGTMLEFNSRKEFYYFLKKNAERYYIHPEPKEHLSETYNFLGGPDLSEIPKFFSENGYIPYLKLSNSEVANAFSFYTERLPEATFPITLSLKRTLHDKQRNADPIVWQSFIDKSLRLFPKAMFVILGLRDEVFDGLRQRPNVIIAKDYGTTVIEDLALVQTAFLYMGTDSGINTIARFSDTPYLIFQVPVKSVRRLGSRENSKFVFAADNQKIFDTSIPITTNLLISEVNKIVSKLNLNEWKRVAKRTARKKHAHPTASILP